MSERTCYRWYTDFQNGWDTWELDGGTGTGALVSEITEETMNTGAMMIRTNPQLTVTQLVVVLKINKNVFIHKLHST